MDKNRSVDTSNIQKNGDKIFGKFEIKNDRIDLKNKVLNLKTSIQQLRTQVKRNKDRKTQIPEIQKISIFSEKSESDFEFDNFCETTNTSICEGEDDIRMVSEERLSIPILSSRSTKFEIETVYEAEKEESDTESSEDEEEESGGGLLESIVFGIGMFFW